MRSGNKNHFVTIPISRQLDGKNARSLPNACYNGPVIKLKPAAAGERKSQRMKTGSLEQNNKGHKMHKLFG